MWVVLGRGVINEEGGIKGGLDCGWGWRGYSRHSRMARPAHTHTPVVIFISDIFGVDLVNTKLLADEWAGAGWKVLLPDFLEGDAVGHEHLKVGRVRGPNASAGGRGPLGGRRSRSSLGPVRGHWRGRDVGVCAVIERGRGDKPERGKAKKESKHLSRTKLSSLTFQAIVPNVRDKEKLTLATKATNAAETAAALGPWVVKHREAGE